MGEIKQKQLVDEYAKPREYPYKQDDVGQAQARANCQSTTVEPLRTIMLNDFEHAGIVTHRCVKDEGHKEVCECGCGKTWMKFGTVK